MLSDALADSSMMQDEQQAEETTYVMPTAYPVATPAQPCSIYQQPQSVLLPRYSCCQSVSQALWSDTGCRCMSLCPQRCCRRRLPDGCIGCCRPHI